MNALRMAVALSVVLGLAGCDSGTERATIMPDVTGQTLAVALSDIERAGVDDEVEVVGGGAFGVVNESNWQVCEQLPASGEGVTALPRLTVDRACDDGPRSAGSDEPSESPVQEPDAPEASPSTSESVLTAENSEDLAALLSGPGGCAPSVAKFADEYRGREIAFDGNIAFMDNHQDYDTRFDFLIYVGNYSETGNPGPSFNVVNESLVGLNLVGPDAPSVVTQGDNLRIVATVEDFTEGCLLRLDPVSTKQQ